MKFNNLIISALYFYQVHATFDDQVEELKNNGFPDVTLDMDADERACLFEHIIKQARNEIYEQNDSGLCS